ncbi:MAG: hypothetical protein FWF01_01900 [Alphaproteobacteria bacterium]|nr:hypothetical protein [Alphaproteobacteria bacterium]
MLLPENIKHVETSRLYGWPCLSAIAYDGFTTKFLAHKNRLYIKGSMNDAVPVRNELPANANLVQRYGIWGCKFFMPYDIVIINQHFTDPAKITFLESGCYTQMTDSYYPNYFQQVLPFDIYQNLSHEGMFTRKALAQMEAAARLAKNVIVPKKAGSTARLEYGRGYLRIISDSIQCPYPSGCMHAPGLPPQECEHFAPLSKYLSAAR